MHSHTHTHKKTLSQRYRQRQALTQFHARMNGRHWLKQRDWLSDKDHCLWQGVACCSNYTHISNAYLLDDETGAPVQYDLTCSTDGAVVGLQQQGNNLKGVVDPAFYAAALAPLAPTMEYLFMRGNLIYGPLALLLRGMHNLRVISLSNNNLTSTLPAELGGMARLRSLIVANNFLTGTLPTAALRRLDVLQVCGDVEGGDGVVVMLFVCADLSAARVRPPPYPNRHHRHHHQRKSCCRRTSSSARRRSTSSTCRP